MEYWFSFRSCRVVELRRAEALIHQPNTPLISYIIRGYVYSYFSNLRSHRFTPTTVRTPSPSQNLHANQGTTLYRYSGRILTSIKCLRGVICLALLPFRVQADG